MKVKYSPLPEQNNGDTITAMLKPFGIKPSPELTLVEENQPTHFWMRDENNIIVGGNKRFKERHSSCIGKKCHTCLMDEMEPCKCCCSTKSPGNRPVFCNFCRNKSFGNYVNISHTHITSASGCKFVVKSYFDLEDVCVVRKDYRKAGEGTAMEKMLIVMCASCSRVKDPHGRWDWFDNETIRFFDMLVSHGICPECAAVLYPDINLDLENEAYSGENKKVSFKYQGNGR